MRWFRDNWTPANIATYLHRKASQSTYDGQMTPAAKRYADECKVGHLRSGSILMLTRDVGMHDCGWWKNPDYNQCIHLSLSFRDPQTGKPRERDKEWSRTWVEAVFGPVKTLIWTEPPTYPEGKRNDVYHYRVFYAPGWVAPILPRGEVYSKDWTPAGWLSWSDARAKLQLEADIFENSQP